jgi:hypothetical protein
MLKEREQCDNWPPARGQHNRTQSLITDVAKRLLVRVVWYTIIKPLLPQWPW